MRKKPVKKMRPTGIKGLLKTLRKSSYRRTAMFAFSELLNITEGRSVF